MEGASGLIPCSSYDGASTTENWQEPKSEMAGNLDPTQTVLDSPTAAPHPEEMKGTVTCNLGNWASITATGRATPAGLLCAAALVSAVMIPILVAVRRR